MDKKRNIEIRDPIPLNDQETAIGRMRGERWIIDTLEPTVERALRRKGYLPFDDDGVGHGVRFALPPNAITFPNREAVEKPHQAQNLPNRTTNAEGSTPESSKVGEKTAQNRTIDHVQGSSVVVERYEPKRALKSLKGEEITDDESETSTVAKASRSAGSSS
jgi:hypothetical protein